MRRISQIILFTLLLFSASVAWPAERLRLMIETDAGGDPDDEQSLVRFLVYSNEWDIEGIIANRPQARDKENLNVERTGLGIVRAMLKAYGQCHPKLVQHDSRFPTMESLWQRTVSGYEESDEGVKLIMAAVDKSDPRPLWFCNWGTDHGAASSSLKRALDRVQRERGQAGYETFKSRLRLSSDDKFGEHTTTIEPPFPIWIDTLRPELNGKRWYRQFSPITLKAGGFDIERDVRQNHGPLGALYPTNTGPRQKEGDTMMFLYLVPTGMNDPERPEWGSWAGRYGPKEIMPGKPYFWANQSDTWNGTTSRENTLARWAADFQNDFRARMDWCVKDRNEANHAPEPRVRGDLRPTVRPGEPVNLDASASSDPDNNALRFQWWVYPEVGTYKGKPVEIRNAASARASFVAPEVDSAQTIHVILTVTDDGEPALTRYQRVVVTIDPAM